MEQTARINEMERRMDRASAAVMELSAALDRYAAVADDLDALSAYYASDNWKKDFADDEAGRLPANLKRGVLSEDGLWNLLEDNRELRGRMREIASK